MVKKPRILLQTLFVLILSIYTFSLFTHPIYSDEASDLQQQIDQKNAELAAKQTTLSSIEAKIKEISGSNNTVSQKIALINTEITKLNDSITLTEGALNAKIQEIADKQALLESKKTEMDKLSTDLYIRSRYRMATFFLSGNDWDTLVKEFFLKQNSISTLKNEVEEINGEFSSLAESRAELETQKATLDAQKKDMDDSYALLAAEKSKLQTELNNQNSTKKSLSSEIGGIKKQLSELQNFLLVAKSGGTVIDANSLPPSTSRASLQYFNSNAPTGSFAVFSFGAYTHRNGMSQWGAKARDDAGQSYTQILSAYYPGTILRTGIVGGESVTPNITVDGYGSMPLETYLLGIHEIMPNWNNEGDMNLLKAQVIAARTYAVRRTNNGRKSICTTQACQVYSRPDYTGAWATAVSQTAGQILTDSSGNAVSTEYAAVHGGYGNNVQWDTTDGTGSGDWVARAWERLSEVTWFYRNWFDYNGSSYNACSSHPNPWLTNAEMADLINAYKYWTQNSSADSDSRLVAIDVGTCWGQAANPYSMAELKAKVSNPVTSVSNVYVTNSNGTTTGITFVTNAGNISVDPTGFKKIYSLRAPGFLSIPQSSFTNINIEVQ